MATILSNPQEVPAPAPPGRRYGLFDAAVMPGALSGPVVASGLTFPAEDCGVNVTLYDPTCAPPHAEKPFVEGMQWVESAPYWALTTYQCGTVGTTAADVSRRVRRRYDAGVQWAIEATVWTGSGQAGVPSLSTATATTVTPDAPGAGAAIAALEEAFYDQHGYVGTIHMNQRGYAAAQYAGLLTRQGGAGALRTPLGSSWALGAGYGVTGPEGADPDPGFVWAFMTPQVYLWETPVPQPDPVQTLDRLHNQWMAVNEAVWLHAWLCDTVMAVQVPVAAPATVDITPAVTP
ncbi:hypothetical protein AB0891_25630 [Streptomyces sp. NPDC007259]|uniref:hypothetical protein n=1 Tax=Streptomyces sp. NPDC007259 TaxID=3154319 RepID=UPI003456D664